MEGGVCSLASVRASEAESVRMSGSFGAEPEGLEADVGPARAAIRSIAELEVEL